MVIRKDIIDALKSMQLPQQGLFIFFKIRTSLNEDNRAVPTIIEESHATVTAEDENEDVLQVSSAQGRLICFDAVVFNNVEHARPFSRGIFMPLNREQMKRLRKLRIEVQGIPSFVEKENECRFSMTTFDGLMRKPPEGSSAEYTYSYDVTIDGEDRDCDLYACRIECTQGNYRGDSLVDAVTVAPLREEVIMLDVATAELTDIDDTRGCVLDSFYEAVCCLGMAKEYEVVTGYSGVLGEYSEVAGISRANSSKGIDAAPHIRPLFWEEGAPAKLGREGFSLALTLAATSARSLLSREEKESAHKKEVECRKNMLEKIYPVITEESSLDSDERIETLMNYKLAEGLYVTYLFDGDGSSFFVSGELAEHFGIDFDCIHKAAMENAMKAFPVKCEKLAQGVYIAVAGGSPCPESALIYPGVLSKVSNWLSGDLAVSIVRGKGVLLEAAQELSDMTDEFFREDEYVFPSFDYVKDTNTLSPVPDEIELIAELPPEIFSEIQNWIAGE